MDSHFRGNGAARGSVEIRDYFRERVYIGFVGRSYPAACVDDTNPSHGKMVCVLDF